MGFADAWKKAGEPVDEFDPPDGPYSVKVVDTRAWTTNDGRDFAKVTLEVTAGEHRGRQFEDFMNFNNEFGVDRATDNLLLYGVSKDNVADVEDLDNALLELTGTEADVTVKHNTSAAGAVFLNVRVNRAKTGKSDIPSDQQSSFDTSDMQPVGAKPHGPYSTDDDDIPF